MVTFGLHPSAVVGSEKLLFSFRRHFGHSKIDCKFLKVAVVQRGSRRSLTAPIQ
tara:strand:+ start:377 stop:538 length:162 start_codon:yes stop_codon:yes gene_type:complete